MFSDSNTACLVEPAANCAPCAVESSERARQREIAAYLSAASFPPDLPSGPLPEPLFNGDPTLNALVQLGAHRLGCDQSCEWTGEQDIVMAAGQLPPCLSCPKTTIKGRKLKPGHLRPDIVLYGEEDGGHLAAAARRIKQDLSCEVDLLLILGTSLAVSGSMNLARDFAKKVHSHGGTVVFVNRSNVAQSVWSGILDFWVEWDCDCWVRDLKRWKPSLREPLVPKRTETIMKALPAVHILREPCEPDMFACNARSLPRLRPGGWGRCGSEPGISA